MARGVWGRGADGPQATPDVFVTDFACRLHLPARPPSPSPLAWLLSREPLGSWCSCPSQSRLPAGALTDESLLPPWGQAREGVEGGWTWASEAEAPSSPAEAPPCVSSALGLRCSPRFSGSVDRQPMAWKSGGLDSNPPSTAD